MHSHNGRFSIWIGLGSVAALSVISLAVLSASAASKIQRHHRPLTRVEAMREIRAAFPVFDRPQRPQDTVRLFGQRRERAAAATSGSQSRLVYSSQSGRAYLYTHGTDLCFAYVFAGPPTGESGGCAPAPLASKIGLGTILSITPGGYSSWGPNGPNLEASGTTMVADAVPAGVQSITVDMKDGTQETLRTVNNTVVFNGSSARDWSFIESGGTKHVEPIQ